MVRARTDGTGRARHRARKAGTRAGDGPPAPETSVSEASALETSALETSALETSAPEVPGTGAPDARTRILDAAEELFAGDGFDATPTSRIAEQAGVAKALLFYYFPRKDGLLEALIAERLPEQPMCRVGSVAQRGDLTGSLVRLARALDLGGRKSRVLRAVLFRDLGSHPSVLAHRFRLRTALVELTEQVLDAASPFTLDRLRRRQAADTYVSLMLVEADHRRFAGVLPDLAAAASIVSRALAGPALGFSLG
ncbi:MAG: TetR/AcrR family transcriptional regulator [Oryzihumus sp.]